MRVKAVRFIELILIIAAVSYSGFSCGHGKTRTELSEAERAAIEKVIGTTRSDITWPERDYAVCKNPEGAGWYVTNKYGAEYLVKGDTVYAINGSAMTYSPGIPNVRDAGVFDYPGAPKVLEEKEDEKAEKGSTYSEYGITLEKKKRIYYELVEYQDEHPGQAEESYRVIARRYGLTEKQIISIAGEGSTEHWPMPEYPH